MKHLLLLLLLAIAVPACQKINRVTAPNAGDVVQDAVDDVTVDVAEDTAPEDADPADGVEDDSAAPIDVADDAPEPIDASVTADSAVDDSTVEDASADAAEDTGPLGPPEICIGISPPASAFEVPEPPEDGGNESDAADSGPAEADAGAPPQPEIGEPAPDWTLYDFQPQSCGFTGHYGLDVFKGEVTVAVLLASW
jgi:hypothetical protein